MKIRTQILCALLVALVGAFVWFTAGASPAPEPNSGTDLDGVETRSATPTAAAAHESAAASRTTVAKPDREPPGTQTNRPSTITGSIRWANGDPATDCVVRVELADRTAATATTDATGCFASILPNARSTPDAAQVRVQPPCWDSPHAMTSNPVIDGEALRLPTITLPNVVDVELDIEVPTDLLPTLEERGVDAIEFELAEAVGRSLPSLLARETLASGSLPLVARQRRTLRIAFEPLVTGILGFSAQNLIPDSFLSAGERGRVHAAELLLEPSREHVALLRLGVRTRHVISGVVVDHLDRPIAAATAEARTPRPDLPGGFARNPFQLDTRGGFVFFHEDEGPITLAAAHLGEETTLEVVPGTTNARIVIDLTGEMRLRVVHGSEPVENFHASNKSAMFATASLPPLPSHPDGEGWMPRSGMTAGDWFTVGWEHDGRHYEETVPSPQADSSGLVTLDLATLDAVPLGSLRIDCGTFEGSFELERIAPAPPTRLCRLHRRLATNPEPIQLRGIRPGRYRVTLHPTGAWPGARSNDSVFECTAGANAVALDDLR